MADSMSNFSKIAMEAVVAVILLCAVALPIISSFTSADTVPNHDVIESLIYIIPVILAVAVIIGIVYSVILKRRD